MSKGMCVCVKVENVVQFFFPFDPMIVFWP